MPPQKAQRSIGCASLIRSWRFRCTAESWPKTAIPCVSSSPESSLESALRSCLRRTEANSKFVVGFRLHVNSSNLWPPTMSVRHSHAALAYPRRVVQWGQRKARNRHFMHTAPGGLPKTFGSRDTGCLTTYSMENRLTRDDTISGKRRRLHARVNADSIWH